METNVGEILHEKLNEFQRNGEIPCIQRGTFVQKRWQSKEYPSGINYYAPKDPVSLGRYNDPTGRTGICYTADTATVAIAESLGRKYQQNSEGFTLGYSDLDKAQIYTLKTTRETKTIDMSKLQAMLHVTTDMTMGVDQSITQAVTNWAANTPGLDYDGISYPSRHYNSERGCNAFWVRGGATEPLTDVTHSSVNSYSDLDAENFPQNWSEKDISGFEIVTDKLKFTVHKDS